MVSDNDADIAVFELGDDVLDILDCNRVDSCERLIQKNEFRIDGKGAGNLAASPLSS